ncbi:MAG TPA: hypothetical protein VIM58_11770, partial [Candidatus Methylacidiphilales bacterium]
MKKTMLSTRWGWVLAAWVFLLLQAQADTAIDAANGNSPASYSASTSFGSNLYVGSFTTGSLTLGGSGTFTDTSGILGSNPGATGTVSMGGGTWTNYNLYVGSN